MPVDVVVVDVDVDVPVDAGGVEVVEVVAVDVEVEWLPPPSIALSLWQPPSGVSAKATIPT